MRVVFDLDGTLVDSSADLLAAINHVLGAHHLRESDRSENLRYAGLGIEVMFTKTVQERTPLWSADEQGQLVAEMVRRYSENPVSLSRAFDGISELLASLQDRGIELCVISNKRTALSEKILATLFPAIAFAKIHGPDSGYPPKPDPAALNSCRIGMEEGDLLFYVGDTEIDYQTAEGSADYVFLASWGYRGRDALLAMGFDEACILTKPMDLLSIVQTKGETV